MKGRRRKSNSFNSPISSRLKMKATAPETDEGSIELKNKLVNDTKKDCELLILRVRKLRAAERELAKERESLGQFFNAFSLKIESRGDSALAKEVNALTELYSDHEGRVKELEDNTEDMFCNQFSSMLETEFNALNEMYKNFKSLKSSKKPTVKEKDVGKTIENAKMFEMAGYHYNEAKRGVLNKLEELQAKLSVEQMHYIANLHETEKAFASEIYMDYRHYDDYLTQLRNFIIQERDGYNEESREREESIIHEWQARRSNQYEELINLLTDENLTVLGVLHEVLAEDESMKMCKATVDVFEAYNKLSPLLKQFIQTEVADAEHIAMLFRSNRLQTRLLLLYIQKVASPYAVKVLEPIVKDILEEFGRIEVDENKLSADDPLRKTLDPEKNLENLKEASRRILEAILGSIDVVPDPMRIMCHHLEVAIGKKYPEKKMSMLGGIIFLRFICPTLINMRTTFGIDFKDRTLILLSKVVQNVANRVQFGVKEIKLKSMNSFIDEYQDRLTEYVAIISKLPKFYQGLNTGLKPEDVEPALEEMYKILVGQIDSVMETVDKSKNIEDPKQFRNDLIRALSTCGSVMEYRQAEAKALEAIKVRDDESMGKSVKDMMSMEPPPDPPRSRYFNQRAGSGVNKAGSSFARKTRRLSTPVMMSGSPLLTPKVVGASKLQRFSAGTVHGQSEVAIIDQRNTESADEASPTEGRFSHQPPHERASKLRAQSTAGISIEDVDRKVLKKNASASVTHLSNDIEQEVGDVDKMEDKRLKTQEIKIKLPNGSIIDFDLNPFIDVESLWWSVLLVNYPQEQIADPSTKDPFFGIFLNGRKLAWKKRVSDYEVGPSDMLEIISPNQQ